MISSLSNDGRWTKTDKVGRLRRNGDLPIFKQLSERLDEIRARAEQGLITSIQFIKELCQIATETLQAEKQYEPIEQIESGKAALTELFLEMKTDKTPAIVERIVNDIDEIVRIVRFEGWQTCRNTFWFDCVRN